MRRLLSNLRRRWQLVSLLLLLLLVSCVPESCVNSEVARKIQDYTGLDITNPGEVTKAALTGETVGNKTQNEALTAVQKEQSVWYWERQADYDIKDDDYDRAADAYDRAIGYVRTDTPAGLKRAQGLYVDKSNVYGQAAGEDLFFARYDREKLEPERRAELRSPAEYYDDAAQNFERAADELENARDMAALRGDINTANKLSAKADEYRERAKETRSESKSNPS